ncbi:MAG: CBS domain-containing protein [Bdellovibrionales bacterium]|nr:CBS domain-containing protein [Bdellovibrionales bacterium]
MSKFKIPVEEFTTPNPITATTHSKVEELARVMKEHGIRHIPILKNEKVVGIVSDRDLKVIAGLKMLEKSLLTAADIMSVDPVTVDSSTMLDEVAFEMSEKKIGSVIVTENDQLVGIFTVTDALNAFIEAAREEN